MKIFSLIGKIILTGITVFFVLGFISCFFAGNEDKEYYNEGILEVKNFTLERIGADYENMSADDEHAYYRMLIEVENVSHFTEDDNYLWRYYEGGEYYEDVLEVEEDTRSQYYYNNSEQIPAGRQVVLEDILLIRNGIDEVTVTCSWGYEDEEESDWTVPVP